jgi:hypothetical protein
MTPTLYQPITLWGARWAAFFDNGVQSAIDINQSERHSNCNYYHLFLKVIEAMINQHACNQCLRVYDRNISFWID